MLMVVGWGGHSVAIDLSVQDNNKNVLRSIFVLKLSWLYFTRTTYALRSLRYPDNNILYSSTRWRSVLYQNNETEEKVHLRKK